jgi:hypothetical protein
MSVPIAMAADFVLNSIIKLAESSARIRAARDQGRDRLTPEEWQDILSANDAARAAAQAAVDRAIAEGR